MLDKKTLEKHIDEHLSSYKIAEIENTSQTNVSYWLKKYGLKTKVKSGPPRTIISFGSCKDCDAPIKHPRIYCNMTCKATYDAKLFGVIWKSEGSSALPPTMRKSGIMTGKARRFIFYDKGAVCERCGWTYDFGDNSYPPLEVHHKDGNYKNNNYDNLELLCPNCHSIDIRLNPVKNGDGRWLNGDDPRN